MTALRSHWTLQEGLVFLNHGSFGATPRAVLEAQAEWRARMEREPVRFFVRELEPALDAARERVARFVGASPEDLAFVPNATHGVGTVLRSLAPRLRPGDELLTTDHAYNACRNALEHAAELAGARVVVASVPFPLRSPEEVLAPILAARTERTRLALLDHVTSPTGLVFPIERLVAELEGRGVEVLVDGAHGPGMLPLRLETLGASYYTGNFHKWLCAPKGAAMLHVRRDRQAAVRPLAMSHGMTSPRTDRSRFQLETSWNGTFDPTPYLCVPAAMDFLAGLAPGGLDEVAARNRAQALAGRRILCAGLDVDAPAPDEMLGALASLPLPDADEGPPTSPLYRSALQDALFGRHGIEVPIVPWPAPPRRLVRISAHLYNEPSDYARLAEALRMELSAR